MFCFQVNDARPAAVRPGQLKIDSFLFSERLSRCRAFPAMAKKEVDIQETISYFNQIPAQLMEWCSGRETSQFAEVFFCNGGDGRFGNSRES